MIGNGIWFLASAYLLKAFFWPLEGLQNHCSFFLPFSQFLAMVILIDLFKVHYVLLLLAVICKLYNEGRLMGAERKEIIINCFFPESQRSHCNI